MIMRDAKDTGEEVNDVVCICYASGHVTEDGTVIEVIVYTDREGEYWRRGTIRESEMLCHEGPAIPGFFFDLIGCKCLDFGRRVQSELELNTEDQR